MPRRSPFLLRKIGRILRSAKVFRSIPKRRRFSSLRGLFYHVRESSECEKHADDRHDLRHVKIEDAFQGIFGPVPKLADEQDGRERRDSEISDETVDFYERGTRDVQHDERYEAKKRVDDRQRDDRGSVRVRDFGLGIRDSEGEVRRFPVDLSPDEGAQIPDDSCEKEREDDRVEVFSKRELVLPEPVIQNEEESERPARQREVVVVGEEETEESDGNDVPPFRKEEKQPGKYERGQKERKYVPYEKIRVDSQFSGHLVEHPEKQEKREGERYAEGVYGDSEEFELRVHAVL